MKKKKEGIDRQNISRRSCSSSYNEW